MFCAKNANVCVLESGQRPSIHLCKMAIYL
jgi:hypothetical protein